MSFFDSDLRGAVLELSSGMNRLKYWIKPRNCWSSTQFVGVGFDLILSHFSGSGWEPFSFQIRPLNFICLILHFFLLKTNPYLWAVSIVLRKFLLCSLIVLPYMQIFQWLRHNLPGPFSVEICLVAC